MASGHMQDVNVYESEEKKHQGHQLWTTYVFSVCKMNINGLVPIYSHMIPMLTQYY